MSKKLKVNPQQIVDLYMNGITATKVAEALGVGVVTVLKYLRLNNIPIRGEQHRTSARKISRSIKLDINELNRLYTIEHLPSTEIAKRFDVTFPTILRNLRNNNIPIRDSHNQQFNKHTIKTNELPPVIKEQRVINNKLTGKITCPICYKVRRRQITRPIIKEVVRNSGKCNACITRLRAIQIDKNVVQNLYENERLTTNQIATRLNTTNSVIRRIIEQSNIPTRKKGVLRIKVVNNKGTIESPELGDTRRGYEIGLNNKGFYVFVSCQRCNNNRWENISRINENPLCKPCAMKLNGERHRGENAPAWLGGISFEPYTPIFNEELRERIRRRDNYQCQLCGFPQNGKKLSCHHIDYNKKNSNPDNLISLCPSKPNSCHSKTNHNRPYWTAYFTNLLKSKGLYITE